MNDCNTDMYIFIYLYLQNCHFIVKQVCLRSVLANDSIKCTVVKTFQYNEVHVKSIQQEYGLYMYMHMYTSI